MKILRIAINTGLLLTWFASPVWAQALPPGMTPPPDANGAFVIWPDGPPGTTVTGAPEQTSPFRLKPSVEMVRNVEVPTLTAFLPAPGKGNGTAVIVAPGGGGITLDMTASTGVARWLRDQGIAAFVLRYRLPQTPRDEDTLYAEFSKRVEMVGWDGRDGPSSADTRQAIRVLRSDPKRWGIDPQKIGVIGQSAGGMFTTLAALRFDDSSRPDFVASIYGVHPLEEMVVPPDAPPMFLAYAMDDPFMSGGTVFDPLLVVKAWRDAGVPVELHAYETGGHGFHTESQGTTSDGWTSAFARWMKARKFLRE